MVFGLFNRKSTADEASPESRNARLPTPTPTPSIASVAHNSPLRFSTTFHAMLGDSTTDLTLKDSDVATDSVADGGSNLYSLAPPPPETPTPPLGLGETKALYDLVLTIPPKTLHAYTLAHLHPPPPPVPSASDSSTPRMLPDDTPRPPSPNTVAKLTTFFSTLAPPPLLHCVRCHKDFFDVENEDKDKACRVPHDDESALVSRVSGGGYETLWGCCGQTVPGDGSEGPPDGWCYEGRHTTDIRRARFRADSTVHHDKLTSCLKLNCRGIRDQFPRPDAHRSPSRHIGSASARRSNPSPVRSLASVPVSRSSRKRPRKSLKEASGSENEADEESSGGHAVTTKRKEKGSGAQGEEDKDTSMAVDEPESSSKPRVKAKSRPISRARPPLSTSTTASLLAPETKAPSKARTTTQPKSKSTTLLSQSQTHPPSDSDASTRVRPRTRSHVREESRAREASRGRPHSKVAKMVNAPESPGRTRRMTTKPVSRSSTFRKERETDDHRESEQEGRGRARKKRRVGRD